MNRSSKQSIEAERRSAYPNIDLELFSSELAPKLLEPYEQAQLPRKRHSYGRSKPINNLQPGVHMA